jgi:hypothetical protein
MVELICSIGHHIDDGLAPTFFMEVPLDGLAV